MGVNLSNACDKQGRDVVEKEKALKGRVQGVKCKLCGCVCMRGFCGRCVCMAFVVGVRVLHSGVTNAERELGW